MTLDSRPVGLEGKEGVLRGIFIARFDQILGAIPSHMHPHGFVTEEQARDAAIEAMLLPMFGGGERTASIMGFERLDFVGYVLVDFDSALGNYVVVALFDSDARRLLWEKHNTIKCFLVNVSEAVHRSLSIEDALASSYQEISALQIKPHMTENTAIERDDSGSVQPRIKSSVCSLSLAIESIIVEAASQQPEVVGESVWQKIKKVVLALIQFSRASFGEEFTKTEIVPHLLRKDQRE